MSYLYSTKLSNSQRLKKRERILNEVRQCWTPPKYNKRERIERKFGRMQKKFGYDYDYGHYQYIRGSYRIQCQTLRYLYQEFEHNAMNYLGNRQLARKMGKDFKRERNQQYHKPLKMHPLIRIFNRLEYKWNLQAKEEGLLKFKALVKGSDNI